MSNSEKVFKFLDEAKVFYLSTIDGDKPRCRPLGFKSMKNDKVYFGVGTFKNVCKQLEKNPNCELVALKGAEWIRINGKAVLEKDFALADEFLGEEKNNWKLMIFHIEGTVEIIKMMKAAETFEI